MEGDLNRLVEEMHLGKVKFSYKKKDGTERVAIGTLSSEVIPQDKMPSNECGIKLCDSVTRYYDTECDGWRSFMNSNYIGIIDGQQED